MTGARPRSAAAYTLWVRGLLATQNATVSIIPLRKIICLRLVAWKAIQRQLTLVPEMRAVDGFIALIGEGHFSTS